MTCILYALIVYSSNSSQMNLACMAPDVLLSFWMLHRHSSHHRPILRQPLSAKTCKGLYQAIDSKPESRNISVIFQAFQSARLARLTCITCILSTCVAFFLRVSPWTRYTLGIPGVPRLPKSMQHRLSNHVESIHWNVTCVSMLKVKIRLPDFFKLSHPWLSQTMSCQITIYSWRSGCNLQASASYSGILKDQVIWYLTRHLEFLPMPPCFDTIPSTGGICLRMRSLSSPTFAFLAISPWSWVQQSEAKS